MDYPVVRPWKEMMNGNFSMQSLLDISRGNTVAEEHDDAEKTTDKHMTNITSALAQSFRFEGTLLDLTSNGVQMAISETFKQLKEHQTNRLQKTDQVIFKIIIQICSYTS